MKQSCRKRYRGVAVYFGLCNKWIKNEKYIRFIQKQVFCINHTKKSIFYDESLTLDTLPCIICCIQEDIQDDIQDEKR